MVLDSGASTHVLDPDLLSPEVRAQLALSTTAVDIKVGGGSVTGHKLTQPVIISGPDNFNNTVRLTLLNVVLVPRMGLHLISLGRLIQEGGFFCQDEGDLAIKIRKQVIPVGIHFIVFVVPFKVVGCGDNDTVRMIATSTLEQQQHDDLLWHRRLMHLNFATIRAMAACKETGVPMPYGNPTCESCPLGKSHRHTITSKPRERTTAPGDLLHIDILGPVDPPTGLGNKYVIGITDDYTRLRSVYFTQQRTGAIVKEAVSRFNTEWCVPAKVTIRRIRTDHAKEFISGDFAVYCRSNNIKLEPTPPYCQALNGVAERSFGVLVEGVCLPRVVWLRHCGRRPSFTQHTSLIAATPQLTVVSSSCSHLVFGKVVSSLSLT
jgi:hypothetical protein